MTTAVVDTGTSEKKTDWATIGMYSAFGVGAVGLVAGTIFTVRHGSKRSEADDLCNLSGPRACPVDKRSQIEDADNAANTAGTLAVVGFAVGAAGIGTGVGLFLMNRHKTEQAPATAYVHPWVGVGSVGVNGRF
jgi:hypothetical protein